MEDPEEVGEALGHACGIFDNDGGVGVQSRYRERHGDAMVVVAVHVSAPDASAPDFHRILFVEIDLDAEFGVLLADRLGAVALLVLQPGGSLDDARSFG